MSSLPHHLDTLPQALRLAMGHCFFPTNISDLVTEYNNHTLVISSDRSVINNDASHAWILYGTHTKTRAYGHGFVPGGGQALSSLQAEIGGFVGGMLALDVILSTALVTITPHCGVAALIDNMTLINQIQT